MTENEKAIITAISELGAFANNIAQAQAQLVGFIAERLPNLAPAEKQVLLNAKETLTKQLDILGQSAKNLRDSVK